MSNRQRYSHLDALENQSVYIIREAYRKFRNLGLLWSIGKDSSVLLWLLRKAFFGHIPIPCVHVDTSYKMPEMIAFRDRLAAEWGIELVVGQNHQALAEGRTFPNGRITRVECCGLLKKDALQAVIEERGYDAVIVGIRRDEEGTRAKERYFSPRNRNFEWDFKEQPPELWDQFKTDYEPGTHIRVHPLLHWTEVNVWEYIEREAIPIVSLYLARNGVRYRSLGCAPCTKPVASTAGSVGEIISELRTSKTSERSTRAQDQEAEDAFERLRAGGYM
ncbi:MAG: sulfate adenylyltransferase subunit 2 [Verrucomicrobia bacterium]|nr:sulfate adenylyltransferase subunit 2 [Verrucomicrobiota bacterium]